MLRGNPKSGNLCEIWESTSVHKWYGATHKWLVNAVGSFSICLMHLRKVMKHSSSNGCLSSHSTVSHLLCWEGTPNLEICVKFESQHRSKWYSATHKWLMNAVKSFSHLPYASKEGYETLKQQWLSLLAVQYHICCAVRGNPKSWNLCEIWESTSVEMIQCNT